jgi:F-type H+-transporting ATPase subunit b
VLAAFILAVQNTEDVKAKNPILPEGKEIVWAVIAFAIVFGLLAWKAWPAIKKALKDREDRIRGDLERAESARVEAEQSLEEYRAQLAEARTEANAIVEQAREAADQVRRDLIARAETDAAELRSRAADDIRLATERAMSELHGKVAQLSIDLAEKVIEQNLDRDAQIRLIENYINQVGSN